MRATAALSEASESGAARRRNAGGATLTQSHLPPTLQEGDGVRVDDLTRPLEGTPKGPATTSPPKAAARPSGWSAAHHGARDRSVARPALLVLLGSGERPCGPTRPARRGLCHHRCPPLLHLRSGAGDRVDRDRIGRGQLDVSPRCSTRSDPGYPDDLRPAAVRGDRPIHGGRSLPRRGRPHGHHRVLGRQDGGCRGRSGRIRSGNAGLLGRLHRVWTRRSSGIRLMVHGPSW